MRMRMRLGMPGAAGFSTDAASKLGRLQVSGSNLIVVKPIALATVVLKKPSAHRFMSHLAAYDTRAFSWSALSWPKPGNPHLDLRVAFRSL